FGPAIFDRHVLALDIPPFFQSPPERIQASPINIRRYAAQEANDRLLGMRRERPERPGRRADNGLNKISPVHPKAPRTNWAENIAEHSAPPRPNSFIYEAG